MTAEQSSTGLVDLEKELTCSVRLFNPQTRAACTTCITRVPGGAAALL